jgi:ribosome-binding factor A
MANRRTERVSELVKRQIGEIIQELNLANCGLITVTEAVISPDLQEGRIYVSVIGKPEQQQHALSALEHSHGRIQRELAHRVILKYTPKLKFFLDETETHAQRIEHLLDELGVSPADE